MIRMTIAAALLLLIQAPQDADVVGRALQDEIARTKARLKLEGKDAPYFVRYTVTDSDHFEVVGSFGAVTAQSGGRSRRLDFDVRVGNYDLDNTNFGDGGPDFGALFGITLAMGGQSLTVDDDYDAIRHELWLATDKKYKSAVEELEKKKAWLTENVVQDRPDDLAKSEPVVKSGPLAKLEIDGAKWTASVRRLSGIFREFPWVQMSFVGMWAGANNRWLSSSEGTRIRGGGTHVYLIIVAGAQAPDGMKFSDVEMFAGGSAKDLPSEADLEKSLRAIADRLKKLIDAPPLAEEYRGPVMFEEQASAEFFAQVLVPQLGGSHEPLGADKSGMGGLGGNAWKENIGKKVAADSLTVVSDPTLNEFGGRPVFGGWAHDDEGVAAERVAVIEKGVLKTFCMSRIPTRHIKKSNGHARDGKGAAGPVVVEAEKGVPLKTLRERLIAMGKEEGLDSVYVVRRG
ncbi:MAG TPA: metallopeptidase TldD-related protein, partial [Candidatus Eisenbacteria bacterium]|nr:metallopeptidase TldD-related protein [Candidatus Eisenbacteria bacterium]